MSWPGHRRILVVDDETVIRSLLSEMLAGDGYSVTTAEHGAEGLECFRRARADLVISDTHMPIMSGPALVAALRQQDPDLPVIVLNSVPGSPERSAAPDRSTACLNKPFDLSEMRATIARLGGWNRTAAGLSPSPVSLPQGANPGSPKAERSSSGSDASVFKVNRLRRGGGGDQ